MKNIPKIKHGIVRGLESVPTSPNFEGRFGRMFRNLDAASHNIEDLILLARVNQNGIGGMTAAHEDEQTPEEQKDDEENSGISAGYTYLGQFIDHDLTFDPSTMAQQSSDPDAIVDFRTPKFDLDNMYGRGPDDQPYLYDFQDDGTIRMLLGKPLSGNDHDSNTRDLPRNNPATGRKFALIGDKRNDENVIVSQLQGIFLRFHNRIVDYHISRGLDTSFGAIQQAVRFHYQWMVLNDFLQVIIGKSMLENICPHIAKNSSVLSDPPNLQFYHWKNDPFIPVEFSVAAYRFGHSMVRPIYRLNNQTCRQMVFPDLLAFGEFNPLFAIDWKLFFDFGNHPDPLSSMRIQPAYKIDSSLVNPLGNLPRPITGETRPSLAELNLLRGLKLKLPSGQDVARAMGIPVLPDEQLLVGKANEDGMLPGSANRNKTIVDLSPRFAGKAPLWFYILSEAQQNAFANADPFTNDTPIVLGPVGGRIVGEVFVGLLFGDNQSFMSQPDWKPYADFLNADGKFGIVELISEAQKA
jgi:hypothetical protein